jgi:hypothetical protein
MGNPNAEPKTDAPPPSEANQKNQSDASEADKRTIANVRKHESDEEKQEPAFRTGA